MNHAAFTGAVAETKVHDRPLLDQLRSHRRRETSGVCSRAIEEIIRLRNTIQTAVAELTQFTADLPEAARRDLVNRLKIERDASR